MNISQTSADLDTLADHLRNSGASLEQKIDALRKLEDALKESSGEAASDADRTRHERNLARAVQIAGMTQLGELPELSGFESFIDAETSQRLRALCGKPMSKEIEADFIATLDQVKQTAERDAARLQDLQRQAERDRAYRDLLQDMQHLLNELLSGGPAGTASNQG